MTEPRRTLAEDLDDLDEKLSPIREALANAVYALTVRARRTRRAVGRGMLIARYWWPLWRAGTMTTLDRIEPYTLVNVDGQRCIVGRPRRGTLGLTVPVVPVHRGRR